MKTVHFHEDECLPCSCDSPGESPAYVPADVAVTWLNTCKLFLEAYRDTTGGAWEKLGKALADAETVVAAEKE